MLSCVPGQESTVEIEGQSSIVNQVRLSSDINKDIGEWSLETDPLDFTITLKNNSSHSITALGVTLEKIGKVDGLNYTTNSALSIYPGIGGTCAGQVGAGNGCVIKLTFEPTQSGNFHYDVIFNYKTLIGQENQRLSFKALVGIPASLVYTNEKTTYDLGIVEQVDDEPGEKRFPMIIPLEIENKGELSARDIQFNIGSLSAEPNAFTISQHNCPSRLGQFQKCQIDIAYSPHNQDISDPETLYTSSLSIRYGKDQLDKPATLSGSFKSLSTKIVGSFEASGLSQICFRDNPDVACEPTTVGNTQISNFKVINKGYQDAILKKITAVYGDMLVHCEVNGGDNLLCYEAGKLLEYNSSGAGHWYLNGGNPAVAFDETGRSCETIEEEENRVCLDATPTKTQLTLYQFPFLLQDTDRCMTEETRVSGKDILNQGSERCEIGVKFHAPEHFNRSGFVISGQESDKMPAANFPPVEFGVIYDTLWKDKINTYLATSKMLFESEPESYSQARLRVTRFTFGSLTYDYTTPDESPAGQYTNTYNQTEFMHDLGRYAMVMDNSISQEGRVRVKNFGNTKAVLTGVFSPHNNVNEAIPSYQASGANNTTLTCSPSGEPFFRNVRHYCTYDTITGESWINPGETCEIRFQFTPVSETNKIYQNYCMFGIPINDARYDAACLASPSACNALLPTDFREFSFSYLDGVKLNDSLVEITSEKTVTFKLDASLAASGKLTAGPLGVTNVANFSTKSLELETSEPESYSYGFIELQNVGSNSIPYIYLQAGAHLDPGDFPSNSRNHKMSFVRADYHPFIENNQNNVNGLPYKDCYYLIQNKVQDQLFGQFSTLFPNPLPDSPTTPFVNSNFVTALDNYQGNPGTPITSLDKGESCILAIRHKNPYGLRIENFDASVTMEEFSNAVNYSQLSNFLGRFPLNHADCNGKIEIFSAHTKDVAVPADELRFFYYDNDTDTTGGLTPDNLELGNLNYIYQTDEPLTVDSVDTRPSYVYPTLREVAPNTVIRQPEKNFPGITTALFSLPAQTVSPVYYNNTANPNYGTFGSFDESVAITNELIDDIETLSGEDIDDYDYLINLGVYPNVDNQDFIVKFNLNKVSVPGNALSTLTYTPLYSAPGAEGHKITANLDLSDFRQDFVISPLSSSTGFHVGVLEYSYPTNIKVAFNRLGNPCTNYLGDLANDGDRDDNLVMLDQGDASKFEYLTVTKKILVFAKTYQPTESAQFNFYSQNYNVCQNPVDGEISVNDPFSNLDDANCPSAPAFGAQTSHGETYRYRQNSGNDGARIPVVIEDIYGDDLYSQVRFRIENNGTQPMKDVKLAMVMDKDNLNQINAEQVASSEPDNYNGFDYKIVNDGAPNYPGGPALSACTDTLNAGDSCAFWLKFKSSNIEDNFTRWINVMYKFGDEDARVSERIQVDFKVLDPAMIQVEGFGTPVGTIFDTSDDIIVAQGNTSKYYDADYGQQWGKGSSTSAIRLSLGNVMLQDAPTRYQFHLKLTADSGTLQAFIRQDFFNKDTEGGAWSGSDFNKVSNVDGNSRIIVDYDPVQRIYSGEPSCAELQAGDAGMNNGDSCTLVIEYRIDEKFVSANSNGNLNGHEGVYLKYCNNYPGSNPLGCSVGEIYFAFTGDIIFPNADTASGSNLVFSDVAANDDGEASFSWSGVAYNANWVDAVVDYRIKYGSSEKIVSSLENSGNGSVTNREATITGLIKGNYYNFEVQPMLRSKITGDTYSVPFNQGQQKIKLLVPDDGLFYFHDQELLIKPIEYADNFNGIKSICDENVSIGGTNKKMNVMSNSHFDLLMGMGHSSVNIYDAYWTEETAYVDLVSSDEIDCLFPDPSIASSQDFEDAQIYKMVGDTEGAGYRNETSHGECSKPYIWIPSDFIGSGITAKSVCVYEDLDL